MKKGKKDWACCMCTPESLAPGKRFAYKLRCRTWEEKILKVGGKGKKAKGSRRNVKDGLFQNGGVTIQISVDKERQQS